MSVEGWVRQITNNHFSFWYFYYYYHHYYYYYSPLFFPHTSLELSLIYRAFNLHVDLRCRWGIHFRPREIKTTTFYKRLLFTRVSVILNMVFQEYDFRKIIMRVNDNSRVQIFFWTLSHARQIHQTSLIKKLLYGGQIIIAAWMAACENR